MLKKEKRMKNSSLLALILLAFSGNVFAVDGGAVLGGAIGGGAGAAIGSEMGGRNGAIIGGAIGGATGAAIGSQQKPTIVQTPQRERHHEEGDYNQHHDNGRHLGQYKHKHKRKHHDN